MSTITFSTEVHDGIIRIPNRYRHLNSHNIEVTLVVKDQSTDESQKNSRKNNARGALSKYKNPSLIPQEENIWDIVVKEKYDYR
jgi:hypothetical protein